MQADDATAIESVRAIISERWPGCLCATEPGNPDPQVIIGAEAQAFITRGPFDSMGAPSGEPGSFYFHADAPTELAALLLVFARASAASPAPVPTQTRDEPK